MANPNHKSSPWNWIIVAVISIAAFALGLWFFSSQPPPHSVEPGESTPPNTQSSAGPNTPPAAIPAPASKSNPVSTSQTPPPHLPTPSRRFEPGGFPASNSPLRAPPGPNLASLIEASTLVAESTTRPQADGKIQRARIYRRPDSGSFPDPMFRVVDTLAIAPNGSRIIEARRAMSASTLVVRLALSADRKKLMRVAQAQGVKITATSPNGDIFLLTFPGGEKPWALDEALRRLKQAGMTEAEPNNLVFPN